MGDKKENIQPRLTEEQQKKLAEMLAEGLQVGGPLPPGENPCSNDR